MKRLAIVAAVLLALVVTASAVIEAYGEATSPKAPTATLSGTPHDGYVVRVGERPEQAHIPAKIGALGRDASAPQSSGVPTPAQARTVVGALVAAQRLRGVASWMPEKYGPDYLAMRLPRGTAVTICAATCWDAVVNDYGPSKRIHPDRIADIAVERWEAICQLPRSRGVCGVTVTHGLAVAARPTLTLPPTDVVVK